MVYSESHNTEFKVSWRDELLKWICGFANADGGRLYIGVNDSGDVVGVSDAGKLMEDLPNKIQAGIGLLCSVNLLNENGLDYLEIRVNPSSFPVDYHGAYYLRSGSTNQLLTGSALMGFLTNKTGFRWEDVTVNDVSVVDLDAESFKIFRREALKSKRMTEAELNVTNEELLNKLGLMLDGKLKRSAVLLFHSNPTAKETPYEVMIGKFSERGEVVYHHLFDGSLITTADKIVDLIYFMYLKAKITYEHDRRVETYPFAREAIREAIFNSLVHNAYMFGAPIQIRIEEREIIISNSCILPEGWTVDTFMEPHKSVPYNPGIARTFYRAGYIEKWGQGISKICEACQTLGADLPRYELLGNGLRVHFKALESALIDEPIPPLNRQSGGINGGISGGLNRDIIEELRQNPRITQPELAKKLGIPLRSLERKINTLKVNGYIERIGGNKTGHWQVIK